MNSRSLTYLSLFFRFSLRTCSGVKFPHSPLSSQFLPHRLDNPAEGLFYPPPMPTHRSSQLVSVTDDLSGTRGKVKGRWDVNRPRCTDQHRLSVPETTPPSLVPRGGGRVGDDTWTLREDRVCPEIHLFFGLEIIFFSVSQTSTTSYRVGRHGLVLQLVQFLTVSGDLNRHSFSDP